MNAFLNKYGIKLLAVSIAIVLYALTKAPVLPEREELGIKKEFSFRPEFLFEPLNLHAATIRTVNPCYRNIAAWISSVGAAATLTDWDDNGYCNDIVQVDPRYDAVIVAPAGGTPASYKPFILSPNHLPYDPATMAPMGTLTYDFDGDGKMDILVYYWGRTPILFLTRNIGFEERELLPGNQRWFTNAATLADFDGDGHIDIAIANYFPDGSRVLDGNSQDHAQTMQHSMSRAYNGGGTHFFLWCGQDGKGLPVFREDSAWKAGIDYKDAWTLALGACDLDGDMLPELYFANDFGPDRLWYNQSTPGHLHFKELRGSRRFSDIRSNVLGKDSYKGMGVDFGDLDNDGLTDIFVSNITEKYALEESNFAFLNRGDWALTSKGIAPFYNESERLGLSRSGWSWDVKLADFNNDGSPEIVQATGFVKGETNRWPELQELAMGNDELLAHPAMWPSFSAGADLCGDSYVHLYTRSSNGRYVDIAPLIHVDQRQISRGIAIGDIDHDGDLDFVVANQWQQSRIYINEYSGGHGFLGLRIRQPVGQSAIRRPIVDSGLSCPSRDAIGAEVKIFPGRTLSSFVQGGNGHSGKSSSEIFLGLGDYPKNKLVPAKIVWRRLDGHIDSATIDLLPGWHTITLPS